MSESNWKMLKGTDDKYEINNKGQVRKKENLYILKEYKPYRVTLVLENKRKQFNVLNVIKDYYPEFENNLDNEKNTWKTLEETEGTHEINSDGKIRHITRRIILKPENGAVYIQKVGKREVTLCILDMLYKYFPETDTNFTKEELENETWCLVKDYNNYRISSLGRLFNGTKKINGTINATEYLCYSLSRKNEKVRLLRSHVLVAQHFIPNQDNLPIVNHKDGNKINNRLNNLEWCTYSQNTQHAYANNLIKSFKIPLLKLNLDTEEILQEYESYDEAKKNGYEHKNIKYSIENGTEYKGFLWRKKNQEIFKDIEGEIWKELKDCEYEEINKFENYSISNKGRIKNQERLMNPTIQTGRKSISICSEGIRKKFLLHRLVLMAFNIPNPNNLPQVDHIDSNPLNNNLENLRWVSVSENANNINTINKRRLTTDIKREKRKNNL